MPTFPNDYDADSPPVIGRYPYPQFHESAFDADLRTKLAAADPVMGDEETQEFIPLVARPTPDEARTRLLKQAWGREAAALLSLPTLEAVEAELAAQQPSGLRHWLADRLHAFADRLAS